MMGRSEPESQWGQDFEEFCRFDLWGLPLNRKNRPVTCWELLWLFLLRDWGGADSPGEGGC